MIKIAAAALLALTATGLGTFAILDRQMKDIFSADKFTLTL